MLEGLATDLELDNELLTAEWHSDQDGLLASGTVSADGAVTLNTQSLSVNSHTISLTVTDDIGFSCLESIELWWEMPNITLEVPFQIHLHGG